MDAEGSFGRDQSCLLALLEYMQERSVRRLENVVRPDGQIARRIGRYVNHASAWPDLSAEEV